MNHRTLEEYKEEVFDKLDDKTKLEWMYQMSEQLCNVEEYIEDRISVLTVSIVPKAKDQYFNNKCIGGVQELKNIRHLLKLDKEVG